jgi:NADP-dependent 3-hydroxy acid dehydrogenase YdfG
MSDLKNQVAIVTGASSGIGAATAEALAAAGARVVAAARRVERLDALATRLKQAGGECLHLCCDVADRAQVQAMVGTVMETWGRIDIVVNNAGVMPLAPMSACQLDDWDRMIDINLRGLLTVTGLTLPVMLRQKTGHFVNISSVAGRKLFANAAVYCATKAAVHALSEGLRSELAEQAARDGNRIRVTVIAPGIVMTELPESITDEATRAGVRQWYDSLAGPLQSKDIADAILFAVASPAHVNINELLVRPTAQVG